MNTITDDELRKTYEWVFKGAVKDMDDYIRVSQDKVKQIINRSKNEMTGIFFNKFKQRLSQAFGNTHEIGNIKAIDFNVEIIYDERIINPMVQLIDITFINEIITSNDKLKWYLKYNANYLPLSACKNSVGKLKEYLELSLAKPKSESVENDPTRRTQAEILFDMGFHTQEGYRDEWD
jgi:hypothetical protein